MIDYEKALNECREKFIQDRTVRVQEFQRWKASTVTSMPVAFKSQLSFDIDTWEIEEDMSAWFEPNPNPDKIQEQWEAFEKKKEEYNNLLSKINQNAEELLQKYKEARG